MPEESPTPEPSPNRIAGIAALVVAIVAGAGFLVALLQQESGRYFYKTLSLERELAKAKPASPYGLRVAIPKGYRDDPRLVERAVVLEDGRPLPLRIDKIKHVADIGNGRYRVTGRYIYMSAPDNSDPITNGRRYELRVPRTLRPAVFWGPLVVLAGALFVLLRRGPPKIPAIELRPWAETALVMAIAAGTMWWSLDHFSDYSDGWLVIKGAPYSDGMGWLELAKSLSEGRGFSGGFEAHRGGYPLLLGGVFSMFGGASLALAKLFNAAMLALGATSAYLLARAAFGRIVGILLLAELLTGARFDRLVELTLTEPTGFALAAIGLHQLHRACRRPVPWRFGIAGVFLGLSNLVRPFTLLALPLFGAVILAVAWRERWGVRRFALAGCAYVGAAMLVFAPWMIRQKMAWGVATLDLNGAVMLYGAAAPPEPGTDQKRALSSRHYNEGEAEGLKWSRHGERYHFYMGRYRESVADDRGGYLSFVATNFGEFFTAPGFGDGHLREELGAVFFLSLVWLAWHLKIAPLVLLAGLWPLLASGIAALPAVAVVAAAGLVAFACYGSSGRIAVALLAATLFGAGVLNALVGNFALNRGTVFIEWITFLFVAAGIAGIARAIVRRAGSGEDITPDPEPGHEGRFGDIYPAALLAVFAIGLISIGLRGAFATKPEPADWKVPVTLAAAGKQAALANAPDIEAAESDWLVARVRLGEYRWYIPAGRDLGHWARPFEVRPFDRTLIIAHSGYKAGTLEGNFLSTSLTVNIPGDANHLDGERDFLLVGLRHIDEEAPLGDGRVLIETLLLAPFDPETGIADFSKAHHYPVPPDMERQQIEGSASGPNP